MPDPNKFNILDALIPILGGAAAAYSPRYLGQGVQAGAGLYGVMQNQKRYSREEAAQLQHYKNIESQAQIHDALAKQTRQDDLDRSKAMSGAYIAGVVPQPGPLPAIPEQESRIADAIGLGMEPGRADDLRQQVPPEPKADAASGPEYPFAAGSGGTYDKRSGKWSERPAGRAGAAGGKPTNVEAQIVQLNREIRQIGEALKFADPDEEGELQAQLEDAKATRDQLKSQRLAPAGEGANPNATTVEVNIPGVHTEAGKRLAAKYLGK
jgi:hypothetical protein